MSEKKDTTGGQILDGLMSLYDAKSGDAEASAPDLLPLFSGLSPEDLPYTDEQLLARGGMKTILRVHDPKTARYVAMATLEPDSPEELYEPFLREARLTALLDHPNIITIHDIGLTADSIPYFTMELKTGESLDRIIKENSSSRGGNGADAVAFLPHLLGIFLKVCDAVDYAHSQNVVHLDLKPDNIQVGQHGEVVVCDWGLGKLIGDAEYDGGEFDRLLLNPDLLNNMTLTGQIKGTPGFMAPEQVEKEGEKTFETDIYALGAILYKILTNHVPVEGETADERIENTAKGMIASPDRRFPDRHIPQALAAVAMKALASSPKRRYRSVEALRQDLVSYLNGYSTSAENAGPAKEIALFCRRHKVLVTLSALFAITLAVAIAVSMRSILRSERAAVAALTELQEEKTERIRLGQKAAPRYYDEAVAFLAEGRLDEAVTRAETAVALDTKDGWARSLLASLYFLKGQHTDAALTFRGSGQSLYRLVKQLNDVQLGTPSTPDDELTLVERLLRSCRETARTPLSTALSIHWVFDDRPEYRELALRYLTVPCESCAAILTLAECRDDPTANAVLIPRVLGALNASSAWVGRRIPATLGMNLAEDPAIKAQFKALIPDNLALGQIAESNGADAANAGRVTDGVTGFDSFWTAAPLPTTLTIDLGGVHVVSKIKVFLNQFAERGDKFKYAVSLSTGAPGTRSEKVAEYDRFADITATTHTFEIPPTPASRVYLKVIFHSGKTPVHVREIEVY